jgi:hypothetical protein
MDFRHVVIQPRLMDTETFAGWSGLAVCAVLPSGTGLSCARCEPGNEGGLAAGWITFNLGMTYGMTISGRAAAEGEAVAGRAGNSRGVGKKNRHIVTHKRNSRRSKER